MKLRGVVALAALLPTATLVCDPLPPLIADQPEFQAESAATPRDPYTAIFDAFRTHPFVGIGDAHGNVQGDAFRLRLVRDPRFSGIVNDILVEEGNSRHQDLLDRFVSGGDVPADSLRRVWHDTFLPQNARWNMPELFAAVREINRSLPSERRIRVLLGEPPLDWDAMRSSEDIVAWDKAARRDRFAADLVRREVLAKNRRVLALYGAGHFFRRVESNSIVTDLESGGVMRAFTVWTNAAADLTAVQPDVSTWRIPSLALLRGTVLGKTNISVFFGPTGAGIPDAWRAPMEDQFDALLYLGPPASITFARPEPWPCGDPAFVEQLRRVALRPSFPGRKTPGERLKETCVK